MLTKFSNLDDFFIFLELKRAEIQTDYELKMTRELEELVEDIVEDEIPNVSVIKKCIDREDEELIQIAWSTSLETPKRTDTTLIMQKLNLSDNENDNFNDNLSVIGDFDEFDHFDEEDYCIDELIEDYSEIANHETKNCEPVDPLDLLSFPISQFPLEDFDYIDDSDIDKGVTEEDIEGEEEEGLVKPIVYDNDSTFDNSNLCDNSNFYDNDKFDFDIPMSQFPTTQPELAVGFKTGRGNLLPAPSKEAMKRAHSLMEVDGSELELGEDAKENLMPMSMFTTAKGKVLPPPSEEAIKRARSLTETETENDSDDAVQSDSATVPVNINVGFSTAKGKTLPPPSKEALARAHSLISDLNEISNDLLTEPINEPVASVVGFSTAKGKTLPPPSKEALDRAKGLISDIDPVITSSVSVGFSTGKGKSLPPPSEAALKKAANLISDVEPVKLNGLIKPAVPVKSNSFKPVKPAFSLSTAWKRPRKPVAVKSKPPPPIPQPQTDLVKLFDLNVNGLQRFKMKDFFKTTPNLSLSLTDYQTNYEIDKVILELNSVTAQDYKFSCGWSVDSAHSALLNHGANPVSISVQWTRNHYRWIVWKFAAFIRSFPDSYAPANLSPAWVLSQLLYRYEREVHLCQRSAVKKIVERDDAAGKYLCLLVARVTGNKLELSDGWYSIWTAPLDPCLLELVKSGRIHVGMKIEISGATLTGQEGIPVLEANNPDCQCTLLICRNSCRPARWYTKLGFMGSLTNRSVTFLKHLHQIHGQGGSIPAVSVVIDRVYPLLYRENNSNSPITSSRNERDHFAYLETLTPESLQSIKFTPIQRIKVIGNHSKVYSCAIVTFWNPMGEDQRALLQEGTSVIITNLRTSNTCKSANTFQFTVPLSLVSSKSTRLFKDTSQITHIPSSKLIPFTFTAFKSLKSNDSIDFIGIISLGRVGNYFWFCERENPTVTDDVLICLKNLSFSTTINQGDLINFRDLSFNLFDAKSQVAHFTFTDFSDFKRAGKVVDIKNYDKSLKKFKSLIE